MGLQQPPLVLLPLPLPLLLPPPLLVQQLVLQPVPLVQQPVLRLVPLVQQPVPQQVLPPLQPPLPQQLNLFAVQVSLKRMVFATTSTNVTTRRTTTVTRTME